MARLSHRAPCMPGLHATSAISDAVKALQAGGLVVIPTETVYGLAADARNPEAINKIFALKGRPSDHPLIVHISGADQLSRWAVDIPAAAHRLAEHFWPGPLALVLKKRDDVPDEVTGGQPTVALRCPDNALTLNLLRQFSGGLAAPSANRFGRISPTTAQHVRDEFGQQTPLVLDDGPCRIGIESTIIDLTGSTARILRPGSIGIDQLRPMLPGIEAGSHAGSPRVSGDLDAHYAPRTPMKMLDREQLMAAALGQDAVVLCLDDMPHGLSGLSLPKSAPEYAQALYASLRWLDRQQAVQILIEQIPHDTAWVAIADRISRAITGSGSNTGHG